MKEEFLHIYVTLNNPSKLPSLEKNQINLELCPLIRNFAPKYGEI